jgi:hypothetical protein
MDFAVAGKGGQQSNIPYIFPQKSYFPYIFPHLGGNARVGIVRWPAKGVRGNAAEG